MLRWLQGVKRSVDNFKISPYNTAEIIAVKVLLNPLGESAFNGFLVLFYEFSHLVSEIWGTSAWS